MIEALLGQVPEAIYFALFMIFAKDLKKKRILFTAIMIVEYLLLKSFIHFNVLFQLAYTFMTFLTLKVLYKDKTQITDILMFTIASIILIFTSFLCCIPLFVNPELVVPFAILDRLVLFIIVFVLKNKLPKILHAINQRWNVNKIYKIKSLTVRNIFIITFNAMFYIINLFMLYLLTIK